MLNGFREIEARYGVAREQPTLFELYNHVLEPVPAYNRELQLEAHRLRFRVYCLEHPYLDPKLNPDGLEHDEYDEHSVQGILRYRASGATVGAVRLVLNRPDMPFGLLPIHKVCEPRDAQQLASLPAKSTAEISRFSVAKSFRHFASGVDHRSSLSMDEDHRRKSTISHFALGLVMVALQIGMDFGITHVCAVMEPALLRMLGRLGIRFQPIGRLVEYHGLRQPCFSSVDELFTRLSFERPDVWDIVTDRGRLWQLGRRSPLLSRAERAA